MVRIHLNVVSHRISNNAYCKQIHVCNQIRVTILQPHSKEPVNNEKHNQLPKGIMRSVVPLPWFFDVVKGSRAGAPTGDEVL